MAPGTSDFKFRGFIFFKRISEHLVLSHIENQLASKFPPQYIFAPEFVSKYVRAKRQFKVTACLELEEPRCRPPG